MQHFNFIADTTKARLIAAGVAGGNVERGRVPPADAELVPLALVYCRADQGRAAGDPRVTQTELFHTTTLVVSIYAAANSGEQLEKDLGNLGQAVAAALFEDASYMGNFEGCDGVRSDTNVPDEGEGLIGQLVMEFDLLHQTFWQPTFTDDFAQTVTTFDQGDGVPAPDPNPHAQPETE